ncbi:MAG: cytochrome C oxidase Cbb3 [Sphingomonas sp. SCN 67-18]|uniref:cbb3-type cytochrome c oxidase subunit 3 n=1 Tax=uncultured Sphingomonas sp. TaxID=158754 RepID=UPI00086E3489|nr:cbb3-type cytochrome c oxidase subunit 3 [Sphingomonas sp. SCN 67-18]ODU20152.1 MAG: cytochrome C oxidase Cbb3 [Sphingomonas sp. SCN 67-18]
MTYDEFRHFADSYGLIFMGLTFLALVGWTFRKGASAHHERAATMIFDDGERSDG